MMTAILTEPPSQVVGSFLGNCWIFLGIAEVVNRRPLASPEPERPQTIAGCRLRVEAIEQPDVGADLDNRRQERRGRDTSEAPDWLCGNGERHDVGGQNSFTPGLDVDGGERQVLEIIALPDPEQPPTVG